MAFRNASAAGTRSTQTGGRRNRTSREASTLPKRGRLKSAELDGIWRFARHLVVSRPASAKELTASNEISASEPPLSWGTSRTLAKPPQDATALLRLFPVTPGFEPPTHQTERERADGGRNPGTDSPGRQVPGLANAYSIAIRASRRTGRRVGARTKRRQPPGSTITTLPHATQNRWPLRDLARICFQPILR